MAQLFREMANRVGLTQSFSRTANCHDNATMGCFNGTFKAKALYNPLPAQDSSGFKAQNNLIGQYIEFYNNRRPCSVIDDRTPVEYRQRFYSTALKDSLPLQ